MSDILSFIAGLKDTPLPSLLAIFGGLFIFFAFVPKIGKIIDISRNSRKLLAVVGGILLISGGAIYLIHPPSGGGEGVPPDIASQPSLPANSVYSFESGSMGWVAQDYEDSKACVQAEWSDEAAKDGEHSLKCLMDLIGEDSQKSKGEVWVDMSDNPPSGKTIPTDLTNRTISAWVYAPRGSKGDRNRPNGFQIFVKDENWKTEYGPWANVVEGQWVKISLTVSATKPASGYKDAEFDPSRIMAIGVKMGAGGGSTAKFDGTIYIDAIDW
jgi:hypothetical protein